jgi:hypothetical protein
MMPRAKSMNAGSPLDPMWRETAAIGKRKRMSRIDVPRFAGGMFWRLLFKAEKAPDRNNGGPT